MLYSCRVFNPLIYVLYNIIFSITILSSAAVSRMPFLTLLLIFPYKKDFTAPYLMNSQHRAHINMSSSPGK